jgi:hypothetical protein
MTNIVVGQQVFFHPLKGVIHHSLPHDAILAATVARVLPDGRLNLGILDVNGASHAMTEVPLVQKGETPPERGYYAEAVAEERGPKSAEDLPLSAASTPVGS